MGPIYIMRMFHLSQITLLFHLPYLPLLPYLTFSSSSFFPFFHFNIKIKITLIIRMHSISSYQHSTVKHSTGAAGSHKCFEFALMHCFLYFNLRVYSGKLNTKFLHKLHPADRLGAVSCRLSDQSAQCATGVPRGSACSLAKRKIILNDSFS